MPPKHHRLTNSYRDSSWGYGQSSHPLVVEHRLTVLEVKVDRIEEDISEPRRSKLSETLKGLKELLPWCLGLATLAAAAAGKIPWSTVADVLK